MSDDGPEACFVDTNVLVYAVADDDPRRSATAQSLIRSLRSAGSLRTSTQVLQELYVTLTRKVQRRLTSEQALEYLDEIAVSPVTGIDYELVRTAAMLSSAHTLSLWDSLMVVAAARSGAKRLYTEDLQHGRKILGLEIVNPFRVN